MVTTLELHKEEPFTKQELNSYNRRDRKFIRGIQIKENISKKDAIKRFKDYLTGNIKNRKLFRKRVSESLQKSAYGYRPRPVR